MGKYGIQTRRYANVNLDTNGMAIFVKFLMNAKGIWSGMSNTKSVSALKTTTGVATPACHCQIVKMDKFGIKAFKSVSVLQISTLMEINAYFVGMVQFGIKKN